jgi:iron complex transport system substrate-binding protein
MIENLGRIHIAIVNARRPGDSLPYNMSMLDSHTPRRIVCLQPSATVILASLGELDRVVACTKYCADVVPEVRQSKRLIVADSWTSKADEILAAKPDLVIAAVPYQEAAVAEILKAGVRFLGLAPRTLADIYTDIAMIAAVVGASNRAAQVISEMQDAIEGIRRRAACLSRKRVFCEEWGKPVITSQPWVAELIYAAGGEFIGDPGKQVLPEFVQEHDPEVIVAAWCGAGNRVPLTKIIRDRGWSGTSAARNSQVYCISDELLNTPAPTLIQGLRALAVAIHPEAFDPAPGLRSITEMTSAKDAAAQRVV